MNNIKVTRYTYNTAYSDKPKQYIEKMGIIQIPEDNPLQCIMKTLLAVEAGVNNVSKLIAVECLYQTDTRLIARITSNHEIGVFTQTMSYTLLPEKEVPHGEDVE